MTDKLLNDMLELLTLRAELVALLKRIDIGAAEIVSEVTADAAADLAAAIRIRRGIEIRRDD